MTRRVREVGASAAASVEHAPTAPATSNPGHRTPLRGRPALGVRARDETSFQRSGVRWPRHSRPFWRAAQGRALPIYRRRPEQGRKAVAARHTSTETIEPSARTLLGQPARAEEGCLAASPRQLDRRLPSRTRRPERSSGPDAARRARPGRRVSRKAAPSSNPSSRLNMTPIAGVAPALPRCARPKARLEIPSAQAAPNERSSSRRSRSRKGLPRSRLRRRSSAACSPLHSRGGRWGEPPRRHRRPAWPGQPPPPRRAGHQATDRQPTRAGHAPATTRARVDAPTSARSPSTRRAGDHLDQVAKVAQAGSPGWHRSGCPRRRRATRRMRWPPASSRPSSRAGVWRPGFRAAPRRGCFVRIGRGIHGGLSGRAKVGCADTMPTLREEGAGLPTGCRNRARRVANHGMARSAATTRRPAVLVGVERRRASRAAGRFTGAGSSPGPCPWRVRRRACRVGNLLHQGILDLLHPHAARRPGSGRYFGCIAGARASKVSTSIFVSIWRRGGRVIAREPADDLIDLVLGAALALRPSARTSGRPLQTVSRRCGARTSIGESRGGGSKRGTCSDRVAARGLRGRGDCLLVQRDRGSVRVGDAGAAVARCARKAQLLDDVDAGALQLRDGGIQVVGLATDLERMPQLPVASRARAGPQENR